MMTRIYKIADTMVVWLGEGSEEVDLAVRSIPDIEKNVVKMGRGDLVLPSSGNFRGRGLPEIRAPIWRAFYTILGSP
jgi:hypothetical protein